MAEYQDHDQQDGDEGGGGLNPALIASYVAFGKRAVSKRPRRVVGVFLGVAGLVVGLLAIWPRTYHCETRLMSSRSQVLSIRGDDSNDPLRGAADIILRHENLEGLVKQTDLLNVMRLRRPAVLRLKDFLMEHLRGKLDEKTEIAALVWTLGNKLTVTPEANALTIAVDWPDGPTSERIVDGALSNFLETRRVAEISTVSEYIAILEGHATRLRSEVDTIAQQTRQLRDDKRHEAEQALARGKAADKAAAPPAVAFVRRAPVRTHAEPDEDLTRMKALLEDKERAIKQLDDDRSRRLLDLQNKLSELEAKYTSAHPLVLDTRASIAALSQDSPQVASLRAEVRTIEADMKHRTALEQEGTGPVAGGGRVGPADAAVPSAEPLPSEIMGLLQDTNTDLDPAISAQLRYAIDRYSSLRGQISLARVDLDTAEAAFKYRYKVVVPPEVPTKPTKPKVPAILGGGLFGAILLGLLAAIGAELRSGKIVEQWQVEQLALPVLAELRFPPSSSD